MQALFAGQAGNTPAPPTTHHLMQAPGGCHHSACQRRRACCCGGGSDRRRRAVPRVPRRTAGGHGRGTSAAAAGALGALHRIIFTRCQLALPPMNPSLPRPPSWATICCPWRHCRMPPRSSTCPFCGKAQARSRRAQHHQSSTTRHAGGRAPGAGVPFPHVLALPTGAGGVRVSDGP